MTTIMDADGAGGGELRGHPEGTEQEAKCRTGW